MTKALMDVVAERHHQINEEGFLPERDDLYSRDELVSAAVSYAQFDWVRQAPSTWPWDDSWWKPKDRRTNLIKAAALLIAEIERIDRAADDQ